jgi:hypothetical protein
LILYSFWFCDYQVNNRDLSIAVLRAFISKRKQEHEAHLLKIANRAKKASENDSSESAVEEVDNKTPPEDHKTNGKCQSVEETSPEESCTTMEGSVKIEEDDADGEKIDQSEVKGPKELKPPTVLEVFFAAFDVISRTHLSHSSITINIVHSIPDLILFLLYLQLEFETRVTCVTALLFVCI